MASFIKRMPSEPAVRPGLHHACSVASMPRAFSAAVSLARPGASGGPGRQAGVLRESLAGLGAFFSITIDGIVRNFSFFWPPQLPAMGW